MIPNMKTTAEYIIIEKEFLYYSFESFIHISIPQKSIINGFSTTMGDFTHLLMTLEHFLLYK